MTDSTKPRRSILRSIAAKILAIQIISSLLIAGIIGGVGYYGMSTMEGSLLSLYADRLVPMNQLKAVSDAYYGDVLGVAAEISAGRKSWTDGREHFEAGLQTIQSEWGAYLATKMTEDELQLIDTVKQTMAVAEPQLDKLAEILRSQNLTGLQQLLTTDLYPAVDPVNESLGELAHYQLEVAEALHQSSIATFGFLTLLVIGVGVGTIVLATGIVVLVTNAIRRNLMSAKVLAEAVAQGDLSVTAEVNSADEVRDLVDALNTMTTNLRATAAVANSVAEGDLTVETKPLSDRDELGLALERMVLKLRDVITDATQAASNVASGSQQLSATAEQLSQGATEQASSTEEASASMEEMASTIKQSADNAAQTEKIARQSAADAIASGEAVTNAVAAMQTIAQKIMVVQEIARQTDLLALNAAVGAGRRAWPRLCCGGLGSAQAGRTQPVGGSGNLDAVGRYGQGRAVGRVDAGQAGAGHPADGRTGRGNLGRQPRAECRRLADQYGDPAARQGDAAEHQCRRRNVLDLRRAGQPG